MDGDSQECSICELDKLVSSKPLNKTIKKDLIFVPIPQYIHLNNFRIYM